MQDSYPGGRRTSSWPLRLGRADVKGDPLPWDNLRLDRDGALRYSAFGTFNTPETARSVIGIFRLFAGNRPGPAPSFAWRIFLPVYLFALIYFAVRLHETIRAGAGDAPPNIA